ncbi:hypothetical protein YQE_11380, partial [Dendroctonus ponderosae]
MKRHKMSTTYKSGLDFLRSYSGALKLLEVVLHLVLLVSAISLGASIQAQFFCGISIYGFVSSLVLLCLHVRGIIKNSEFPWFWVECVNSALMALLLLTSSSFVVAVLTKGYILTGLGFIAVMVYTLDAIDKFFLARTPRARIVWTTPNMPV